MRLKAPVSASNTITRRLPYPSATNSSFVFWIHEGVGRLVHARRVVVAPALVRSANLQQELSLARELQQHVVGPLRQRVRRRAAAANPDVVLVVDEDAVLAVRPVEACPGAAPRVARTSPSRRTRARRARPALALDPRARSADDAESRRDRGDRPRSPESGRAPSCSAAAATTVSTSNGGIWRAAALRDDRLRDVSDVPPRVGGNDARQQRRSLRTMTSLRFARNACTAGCSTRQAAPCSDLDARPDSRYRVVTSSKP